MTLYLISAVLVFLFSGLMAMAGLGAVGCQTFFD